MILSGGAGTRLWPLSTPSNPKQFISLFEEPLFEATLRRLEHLPGVEPPVVVTGAEHVPNVEQALAATGAESSLILVEPVGRNTAPAVVAAAMASDPGDVLMVLPSDHLIADETAFAAAVEAAVDLSLTGALVTFGIQPTRPETGYGYIEKGPPLDGGFEVARFTEKPDVEEAERLVADGRHLWNSGMFVFTAARILEEARRHVPGMVELVAACLPPGRDGRGELGEGFADVDSISIDHAVMERTTRAAVIPLDAGWSDVGSWQTVWELADRDSAENVLIGDVLAVDVAGSYVRAGTRTVAIAGVEDLIVVETPEAVLIVPRDRSQLVRDLAAAPVDGKDAG